MKRLVPGIKPRAPCLIHLCSTTELRTPGNRQPQQSSIYTAQVVLNGLYTTPGSHSICAIRTPSTGKSSLQRVVRADGRSVVRALAGTLASIPTYWLFHSPLFHLICTTKLVSCPAHARLPARNGLVNEANFLGLFPKVVKTNEIASSVIIT